MRGARIAHEQQIEQRRDHHSKQRLERRHAVGRDDDVDADRFAGEQGVDVKTGGLDAAVDGRAIEEAELFYGA